MLAMLTLRSVNITTETISLMEIKPNNIDANSNENLEENCLSTSTMSNIPVVNNLSSIYDKWTSLN